MEVMNDPKPSVRAAAIEAATGDALASLGRLAVGLRGVPAGPSAPDPVPIQPPPPPLQQLRQGRHQRGDPDGRRGLQRPHLQHHDEGE